MRRSAAEAIAASATNNPISMFRNGAASVKLAEPMNAVALSAITQLEASENSVLRREGPRI
jgi:hypothetical protein